MPLSAISLPLAAFPAAPERTAVGGVMQMRQQSFWRDAGGAERDTCCGEERETGESARAADNTHTAKPRNHKRTMASKCPKCDKTVYFGEFWPFQTRVFLQMTRHSVNLPVTGTLCICGGPTLVLWSCG